MAREDQGNVKGGGFGKAPRVVREQDGRTVRAAGKRGDVEGTLGPETNADEVQRFAVDRQPGAGVFQHLDAVSRQRCADVVVVVVVAEDAEDTVGGREGGERLSGRHDVLTIAPGHVVAAEHDEIRPFVHQGRDRARDVVVRHEAAAMHVGDQANAQSRQRRRQAVHRDILSRDFERMPAVDVAVRSSSSNSGHASAKEALQHRSPTDQ
jgi:hypothetical protein